MGKTVVITEKPSVAREYVRVLGIRPNEKTDGYVEGYSPVMDTDVAVTWCIGHLVTMSYPEVYDSDLKKWSLDTLPFLPTDYRYEVIPEAHVKKQFGIVKRLYHDADLDAIYYAGDSGREGIYIQELVRRIAGHKSGVKEKVVWIDSQTEEEILRGIREAKDISAYQDLIDAAYSRAIEDFAVGINFSRALSCQYGREFNNRIASSKWTSLSVGRVMTCVLGMVVEREREIRNFIETPFYRIESTTGPLVSEWRADSASKYFESPLLYNETGFLKHADAESLSKQFEATSKLSVEKAKLSEEKKAAPLLYNLADLQNECARKYKISPDATLATIQTLYEKKLVTYPRTDARVLSTAVAKEIKTNLNGLKKLGYTSQVDTIMDNRWHDNLASSRYVNDKQITDHYAIIPTGETSNIGSLTDLEKTVFSDIINRFLCIFYPPAVYTKGDVVLKAPNGEHFYGSHKTLKSYGWYEVFPEKDRPEIVANIVSNIKEGSVLDASFAVKEGKTTPPKRYNSGSMVLAMEGAGKLIEDEELRAQLKGSGIGTSATRSEIIKKLVSIKYLDLNNKTQILTPNPIGEVVYDIVHDILPELLSPEMTAKWEQGLTSISEGSLSAEKYNKTLENYITQSVAKIKSAKSVNYTTKAAEKKSGGDTGSSVLGKCPNCGKDVVTGKFGAYCSGKCGMQVGKAMGKTLSDSQIKSMLAGKKTLVKGIKSAKTGNTYDAYLTPTGTEPFSYTGKDGIAKNGVGFKFDVEYPKK